MDITVIKSGKREGVFINGEAVPGVKSCKIKSSDDGMTELFIHIKTKCDKLKADMRTLV